MGGTIRVNSLDTSLALVLDSHPDGVLIVDHGGVVRYANPAAGDLFGAPLHTMVDRRFHAPVRLSEDVDVRTAAGTVLELRTVETVWAGLHAFMVCVRDVTRQRDIEAELRRTRAEQRYATAPTPQPISRVAWPRGRRETT